MKKEAQVHMLPTEDISQVHYNKVRYPNEIKYELSFHKEPSKCKNDGLCSGNQHLYITTDDKIKEGDWFLRPNYSSGIKVGYIPTQADSPYFIGYGYDWTDCRKIIASTDPKLKVLNEEGLKGMNELHVLSPYSKAPKSWYNYLPRPSQAFIEKFCKVGGIDEVDVEYEYIYKGIRCLKYDIKEQDEKCEHICSHCFHSRGVAEGVKPKTDSNNCIIIHPVEEKTIDMKALDICQRIVSFGDASPELMETSFIEIYNKANKWIKENL